jgi:hypothetical protein
LAEQNTRRIPRAAKCEIRNPKFDLARPLFLPACALLFWSGVLSRCRRVRKNSGQLAVHLALLIGQEHVGLGNALLEFITAFLQGRDAVAQRRRLLDANAFHAQHFAAVIQIYGQANHDEKENKDRRHNAERHQE